MIGKTISHYQIIEPLGEGGMGVVYKAQDTNLDRLVAIKFLPFSLTADEQILQQFIHEAKTISTLDHPNICPIHEFDNDGNGQMFMVMPYYKGQTLQDRNVEAHGDAPMPINEIISVAIQIAVGLKKAHEQGIVHRDIKSSNIIINQDGDVKILDFGLAKLKGELYRGDAQYLAGTTQYMSPEQHFCDRIDHRTDIWSLGVVIYEMCSGRLPFQAEYDQSVAYATLKKEHKPLSSICQDIPNKLEQIVDRCLQKDADNRYQNIGELLEDLRSLENAEDQEKKSEKQKSIKRSYLYTLSAFILILIIILGYVFYPGSSDFDPRTTIAVLPFEDLSTETEYEYFSDGITEDIIMQLSKIRDLKVLSRTSVMPYKKAQINLADIAEKTKADAILKGSIRRTEDRISIVTQLFETGTQERLWTETYDQKISSIFDIQIDIVKNIATALKTELSSAEKDRLERIPAGDISGYDYYLRGREYYYRHTREGNDFAIKLFKQAVDVNPNFALAYAGLADAYAQRGDSLQYFSRSWLDSALAMTKIALAIDPICAEAYKAMGLTYMYKRWYQKALEAYYKAIELNPRYRSALANTGHIMFNIGEFDESIRYLKKAVEIDPFARNCNAIGYAYLFLEDYDRAIEWFKKAMELKPDISPYNLAVAYMEQGKSEKAITLFEEMIQSETSDKLYYPPFQDPAIIYQNHGMTGKAITLLEKSLRIDPSNAQHYMGLAGIYWEQGKLDDAITLYKRGIKLDPNFLPLALNYSFLLSHIGKIREAGEVLEGFSQKLPDDDWVKPVVRFYLGELTESEMEKAMQYVFVYIGEKRELPSYISYYLGMAYLHNLNNDSHRSPGYRAKAIEYLQKYHLRGHKAGAEKVITRAELKRLGAFKIQDSRLKIRS